MHPGLAVVVMSFLVYRPVRIPQGCGTDGPLAKLLLRPTSRFAINPLHSPLPLSTTHSRGNGTPLRPAARGLLATWGLFLAAGFTLAASLDPDPRGFGTHQRLGLPPCTTRTLFGISCPSCGMTTSFANFVRGRFLQAAQANTSGLLLATVCAVQLPWIAASVARGRLIGVWRPDRLALAVALPLATFCLAEWLLRLTLLS